MNETSSGVYVQDQYNFNYPEGIQYNYWNTARNLLLRDTLQEWKTANSTLNVLDIGCGRGLVVSYLRQNGFNIVGVETGNATPIDSRFGSALKFNTDAFLLEEIVRDQINVIMLLDVLEHIENPQVFVSKCLSSFKNLKYICVTLPARNELWTNYDDFYGHYLRYDFESVDKLLNAFKLKQIEKSYFFHFLYLPMLFVSFFKKKRTVSYNPPRSIFQKRVHKLFGWLLYLESRIIPGKLVGSSLLIKIHL